jgi:hypothetical protein
MLIVSAGDPMWRGGLSGPSSMFLHSDRPLISENRTSTLLHELGHIALGIRGDEESDWIVEGLAEHYFARNAASLGRHQRAALQAGGEASVALGATLADIVRPALERTTTHARCSHCAAADAEIRSATAGKASIDDVARKLASEQAP